MHPRNNTHRRRNTHWRIPMGSYTSSLDWRGPRSDPLLLRPHGLRWSLPNNPNGCNLRCQPRDPLVFLLQPCRYPLDLGGQPPPLLFVRRNPPRPPTLTCQWPIPRIAPLDDARLDLAPLDNLPLVLLARGVRVMHVVMSSNFPGKCSRYTVRFLYHRRTKKSA